MPFLNKRRKARTWLIIAIAALAVASFWIFAANGAAGGSRAHTTELLLALSATILGPAAVAILAAREAEKASLRPVRWWLPLTLGVVVWVILSVSIGATIACNLDSACG